MKTLHLSIAVCSLLVASSVSHPTWADVLNMGPGLTSLETVPVGDAGNAADTRVMSDGTSGYGRVNNDYSIGKYEVTAGQYAEFLNKVAGVDTYGLYNPLMGTHSNGCKIQRSGSGTMVNPYTYLVAPDYANRPVNFVSYWDACRFANWLHNGQPGGAQDGSTTEDGAYTINGYNYIDGRNIQRNADWRWAVPTEDEWYKSAYYKGGSGDAGYWNYPTRSDSLPGRDMTEATSSGNNANYAVGSDLLIGLPYWRTQVGEFDLSASPYGTFDQGGNVEEWNEAIVRFSSFPGGYRGIRGGGYRSDSRYMLASDRTVDMFFPTGESLMSGFRVVLVPEPVSLTFLAIGSLLLARRRRA
jgi:formylglycine-generating enzyme required for sulfatase activity